MDQMVDPGQACRLLAQLGEPAFAAGSLTQLVTDMDQIEPGLHPAGLGLALQQWSGGLEFPPLDI